MSGGEDCHFAQPAGWAGSGCRAGSAYTFAEIPFLLGRQLLCKRRAPQPKDLTCTKTKQSWWGRAADSQSEWVKITAWHCLDLPSSLEFSPQNWPQPMLVGHCPLSQAGALPASQHSIRHTAMAAQAPPPQGSLPLSH